MLPRSHGFRVSFDQSTREIVNKVTITAFENKHIRYQCNKYSSKLFYMYSYYIVVVPKSLSAYDSIFLLYNQ